MGYCSVNFSIFAVQTQSLDAFSALPNLPGVCKCRVTMDKYVKVRKIGQGSFGCAYLATRKPIASDPSSELNGQLNKQQFVIKEVVLDPRDQANAQREARLLAALDHPNIIACKESFVLKPSAPHAAVLGRHQHRPAVLCIVTEFADGGDLSHELERRSGRRAFFDPDELLGLFVQVCLALKHLHDRKILHRDIKPANIFLTKSGVVKLGDLGVATVLSHTLACAQTSIGTPYYTAPEICLGKRYNAKADVWSLGCVLFEMVSFAHAFEGRSQRQLFDNIVRGSTPQLPACGSLNSIRRELQTLVDDMLRKEPRARPNVNRLIRRPIVLARIQTFLSARALSSELNHTVLHGENVFRKKTTEEEKVLLVSPQSQHVRRAELVARTPAFQAVVKPAARQPHQKLRKTPPPNVRNGKVRVGSLLGASRKPRGLPQGALKTNRPIQKRDQPVRVPARVSAIGMNIAKQRATPIRAKRPETFVSAQVKAKLKAQLKSKEDAASAVAALPDPPPVLKAGEDATLRTPGGISERVAAFNEKWAAQREHLVKNLPPPPPAKVIVKNDDYNKPTPSARAYPKPVVIGKSLNAPPPAPVGISRQRTKQKAPLSAPKTRGIAVQSSLRERRLEFQRKKQAGLPSKNESAKASPLDDPIILVQQLPDFKPPSAPPIYSFVEQDAMLPPPASTTLTSSLPEFADKEAGVEKFESNSTHDEEEQDHELTSLPPMANLELERMMLQLKSVVESDMTSSDSENDDDDEQPDPLFDPNAPPPPYSPPTTDSTTLKTLSISMLEDPAFRLALQKRLLQPRPNGATIPAVEQVSVNGVESIVDPAQQAMLTWMYTYISSLV